MDTGRTAVIYATGAGLLLVGMHVIAIVVGMSEYGYISASFQLVCSGLYIYGWQAIARRSPELMPKYFLAASALRLMAAATVLLVYCVVNRGDIEAIKWFAVVFIVFYLVILAFDAVFFAKVSNNKKVTK